MFALSTIKAHPIEINNRAIRSYCQINFSPRMFVERMMAATILIAELAEIRVRSNQRIIYVWLTRARIMIQRPSWKRQEQ